MLKTGLMGICCAVLAGMTLLPAETPAQTPTQTSTQGNHYLCDFREPDLRRYQDLRWLPSELPIKVYLPQVPYTTPNPSLYAPVVRQAFESWTKVAPVLRFQFVDNPDDAQIKIEWKEEFPEHEGMWGLAYYPIPGYNRSGEVVAHRSKVFLAVKAQAGTGMSVDAVFFSAEELLAIATHEAGHALGLPHSGNPDDLMSPHIFKFSAEAKWGISQRDVNTLYALYGLPKKLKAHPCP